MSIELNHTVVKSKDQRESALFIADILGLDPPGRFAHFDTVQLNNGVTLDFMDAGPNISVQHYAFLANELEFDEILNRIRARSIEYWADPFHRVPFAYNRNDGGRGVYFSDPSGHMLEVLTRPYGSVG